MVLVNLQDRVDSAILRRSQWSRFLEVSVEPMFELDYRLQSDCAWVGDFMLCRVMLMKDANYPWVLLVPKREDAVEIYQLDTDDQEQLIWESSFVASAMAQEFGADKMNVAALGNVVKQLHVHHVVRRRDDPAWPNPVWGRITPRAYSNAQLRDRVLRLQKSFATSTFKPNDDVQSLS